MTNSSTCTVGYVRYKTTYTIDSPMEVMRNRMYVAVREGFKIQHINDDGESQIPVDVGIDA